LDKRVIESNLPLREISKASRHEKSVRHGHPSTLHLWWARRPLASSRTTILATLLKVPESQREEKAIFDLIADIAPWNVVKNPTHPQIDEARQLLKKNWKTDPPKILDPFSGGGSIPLEALRLGCETYASDINPIAVLISKATLEWPQKLSTPLLVDLVAKSAKKVQQEVREEIGQFYPSDLDGKIPIGYLWCRTIPCDNPQCKRIIPLIKHFWLARTKKRQIAYKPIIRPEIDSPLQFVVQEGQVIDFNPSEGTVSRATARCIFCSQVISAKTIRKFAKERKIGQQMTIVVLRDPINPKKTYRPANSIDMKAYNNASKYFLKRLEKDELFNSLVPSESLPPIGTLGFGVQHYGLVKWSQLYNNRQLLSLVLFLSKINDSFSAIQQNIESNYNSLSEKEPNIAKVILTYLTIILGRLADKCSNLVVYNASGEKIEHVFGRTALPMVWDYVELNVFSGANGDWSKQTEWVLRYLKAASWNSNTNAYIQQASATDLSHPDNYFDAVITDPPYYDNVPYADLSDFFYVWFKRALGNIFPELFSTPLTPKRLEIVANKGRQKNPKKFFEKTLAQAFNEIFRVLKPNGIAVFVYAHKSSEGWETMLEALVNTGFTITSSWPIHTEMATRLRARSSAALASSIYLVCRKGKQKPKGYLKEIQSEVEQNIHAQIERFWLDGIRGGDFFISAIGPGMEVFSQYQQIQRYSGEIVSIQEQLQIIRTVSTHFLFKMILRVSETTTLDRMGQFYLAFRWTYGESIVEFGEVQTLAQAYGLNLKKITSEVDFIQLHGSKVFLKNATQRKNSEMKKNHIVNLMHRAVLAWKENDTETLITLFNGPIKPIQNVFGPFCQAVAECLPSKNKEKQQLEGLLISHYI